MSDSNSDLRIYEIRKKKTEVERWTEEPSTARSSQMTEARCLAEGHLDPTMIRSSVYREGHQFNENKSNWGGGGLMNCADARRLGSTRIM